MFGGRSTPERLIILRKKPNVSALRATDRSFIETVEPDPIFQVSSVASANDCTGIAVTVPDDNFEANSVAHLAAVNVTSKKSGK